jgi:hypothetical protein
MERGPATSASGGVAGAERDLLLDWSETRPSSPGI